MFTHLSALAMFLAIPFGNILGPLVLWLIKRQEMPLVDEAGKKALNFQITMAIAYVVAIPLCFVIIGFLLLPAVAIFDIVMVILAAVRTSDGVEFNYPMSIRFLR